MFKTYDIHVPAAAARLRLFVSLFVSSQRCVSNWITTICGALDSRRADRELNQMPPRFSTLWKGQWQSDAETDHRGEAGRSEASRS